jgi:hypothetical protein
MNLAIEYLIRTRLCRDFLKIPCSIFLLGEYDDLVVAIHEANSGKYCIKHWVVSDCQEDYILPPVKEFYIQKRNIWTSNKTIVPEYSTIGYFTEPIRNRQNNYRQPMSQLIFSLYHDSFLDSRFHRTKKMAWLWRRFAHVYLEKSSKTNGFITLYPTMLEIKDTSSRLWKIWLKWSEHMLLNPGELAFWECYENQAAKLY